MNNSSELSLQDLIKSRGGLHLSVYLNNLDSKEWLLHQLKNVLDSCEEHLSPILTLDQKNKFLDPIKNLIRAPEYLSAMNGNVGIFRNSLGCRIMRVPIEVEASSHLASSFHVKPILRWLQNDRGFYLLGVKDDCAHLYVGDRNTIYYVDSFAVEKMVLTDLGNKDFLERCSLCLCDTTYEVKFHLYSILANSYRFLKKPKLLYAGPSQHFETISNGESSDSVSVQIISKSFEVHEIKFLHSEIRKLIDQESHEAIELSLIEYMDAEFNKMGKKNIFQIAKAVRQGQVKKLIVADGVNIFGKFDRKNGGLTLHPVDLDHEDDDLLDDLAQEVLLQGGEVIVAPKEKIPKGRPILAILDSQPMNLRRSKERRFEAIR